MDVKLYRAKVEYGKSYSKSLKLSTGDISITLEEYPKSYEEYVQPLKAYFSEDSSEIAKLLGVRKVVRKGEYIMGIFGGEKKKGKKEYAGLVTTSCSYDEVSKVWHVKLYRLDKHVEIPDSVMDKYGVRFYKLIYRGDVHPFSIAKFYNILLSGSKDGNKKLKDFIKEVIVLNQSRLSKDEIDKLNTLADEVIQPAGLQTLQKDKYYVIYRGKRTFSACVFKSPSDEYVVDSSLSYIDCGDEKSRAYFYTATLNYLAYKAIEAGRSFVRDQYGKPIQALIAAELTWDVFKERSGEGKLAEVVALSEALHTKVSKKDYKVEKAAFRELKNIEEFRQLVGLFDEYVKQNNVDLGSALSLVTTQQHEEPEDSEDA